MNDLNVLGRDAGSIRCAGRLVAALLAAGMAAPTCAAVLEGDSDCKSPGNARVVARQTLGGTTRQPVDGSGTFSVVAGCDASGRDQLAATAYGARAEVDGTGGVAVGYASAAGKWAVATGVESLATGDGAVATGAGSVSGGRNAIAIGGAAGADGSFLDVPHATAATGNGAIAIGGNEVRGAQASADDSIALGGQAQSSGARSLALGAAAEAAVANSVALGAGSKAGRGAQAEYAGAYVGTSSSSGEVNVGQRQVTGVAAGSEDADAVNVAQLRTGLAQSLQAAQAYTDEGVASAKAYTDAEVAAAKAYTDDEVADARAHTDGEVAAAKAEAARSVAAAVVRADRGIAAVGAEVEQLRRGADGVFRVSADDVTGARADGERATAGGAGAVATGAGALALGNAAQAGGAGSVALGAGAVATRENTVSVGAPGHERTISQLADGVEASDAVTVRQLEGVRDRAVQYDQAADGSPDYTAVTLGRGAPVTLGNLAPGSRGDDAVNLSQLQASAAATLDSANAYTDARVEPLREDLWRLDRRVDGLERRMDAGIAAAMGLKQAPAVSGRTTYYVGAGSWRGQQAGGVSLRRTADNGRWSLEGGVSGNREGVGGYIGVSGVLGR